MSIYFTKLNATNLLTQGVSATFEHDLVVGGTLYLQAISGATLDPNDLNVPNNITVGGTFYAQTGTFTNLYTDNIILHDSQSLTGVTVISSNGNESVVINNLNTDVLQISYAEFNGVTLSNNLYANTLGSTVVSGSLTVDGDLTHGATITILQSTIVNNLSSNTGVLTVNSGVTLNSVINTIENVSAHTINIGQGGLQIDSLRLLNDIGVTGDTYEFLVYNETTHELGYLPVTVGEGYYYVMN